ncbi:MAG: methyltransferase domain-containing protein [Methylomonas sp.]|nr:methyltransferase domain-containing protein [Methylomonas sp.]PPD22552.1 MAG: methyltransferase type 11 [Methylomonas sp.]PPD27863.1 MAG: methyltransferase type 11 [Methylomonas sp.]PPD39973.1 MAG: methyltransferase type 11 [Methylomonas sp.]PPD41047.1 MAG: methyltransferase type 11 [Methylomonas sp.]
MKRSFLFTLYQTPRGKLLQTMETQYLKRGITVSCKQTQLQIGGLGWEQSFVDCSLYNNYLILDDKGLGESGALKVVAKASKLPVQTESMDLVIIPHMLEFDAKRFQTLREVDRVLKPGGELLMLCFNPHSPYVRFQFLWDMKLADSWRAHFISRRRVQDWLKLLNFELVNTVEFGLDSFAITQGEFGSPLLRLLSMAYGLKAVKRQYSLIPLTPVRSSQTTLATAGAGVENQPLNQDVCDD